MSSLTLTFVHDCPHAGHNCLDQARTSGEEEIYFQASETRQTSPHVKVTVLLAARRDPPASSISISIVIGKLYREFLMNYVDKEPLVRETPECKELLLEAMRYINPDLYLQELH